MTFKESFKKYLLTRLADDLRPGSRNGLFFFIARAESWGVGGTESFIDSRNSFADISRRMISAKRIHSGDAILMANKYKWLSGATFDMYTSNDDLTTKRFYTTNSLNEVYKCIYNGSTGGNTYTSPSEYEPVGGGLEEITLPDGYKWKFMFRVPESLDRFTTTSEIPIKTLVVDRDDPLKFSDDRFPQYSTQFNAVQGSLSYVDIIDPGASFSAAVPLRATGDDRFLTRIVNASNTGTTATAKLNESESLVDDFYNDYVINIRSGLGVGQSNKIIDYNGVSQTLTLESNWATIPDGTSLYDIMPQLAVEGDGNSASARAVIYNGVTLEAVELTNAGNSYTWAETKVLTANGGTTDLYTHIAPPQGHGADPASEIPASKLMILVRITNETSAITGDQLDGAFPIRNDYHQLGIIRNPILTSGERAGEIAGVEAGSLRDVKIGSTGSSSFGRFDFLPGDFIVGEVSRACGQVTNWRRSTDTTIGTLTLRDNVSDFSPNERIVGLGTGAVWSSSGKGEGVFLSADEPVPLRTLDDYRLTTKIIIGSTGADLGHNYVAADFDLDDVLSGASGSSASLVEYIPAGGSTATIYVTNIYRDTDSGEHGFTLSENFLNTDIVSTVLDIEPPKFDLLSGEILYIRNNTSIERNNEQEEEFKITFDI